MFAALVVRSVGVVAERWCKMKSTYKKMARGGIVNKPARSSKDMKAGAGSGVGRIQKTKIQKAR